MAGRRCCGESHAAPNAAKGTWSLREKFCIEVVKSKGAETFAGISGGEKRKLRIAYALALHDLIARPRNRSISLLETRSTKLPAISGTLEPDTQSYWEPIGINDAQPGGFPIFALTQARIGLLPDW